MFSKISIARRLLTVVLVACFPILSHAQTPPNMISQWDVIKDTSGYSGPGPRVYTFSGPVTLSTLGGVSNCTLKLQLSTVINGSQLEIEALSGSLLGTSFPCSLVSFSGFPWLAEEIPAAPPIGLDPMFSPSDTQALAPFMFQFPLLTMSCVGGLSSNSFTFRNMAVDLAFVSRLEVGIEWGGCLLEGVIIPVDGSGSYFDVDIY